MKTQVTKQAMVNRVVLISSLALALTCDAFAPVSQVSRSNTALNGLFDDWKAGGSGKDRLDEEWEKQQKILKLRKGSTQERTKYFEEVSLAIALAGIKFDGCGMTS